MAADNTRSVGTAAGAAAAAAAAWDAECSLYTAAEMAAAAAAAAADAAAASQDAASGCPSVVCTRGDVLVMQDANGYPYTIHNTPYNRLRYQDYAGRRIMYAFDDDNVIEETYTPGIFNCRSRGRLVQISDTAAVASSIVRQDRDAYADLFARWFSATIQKEYIETYVKGSRRLSYDGAAKTYMVDDGIFKVDEDGNAYSANHDPSGKRIGWSPLCIVNTEARESMEVVDPQLGRISVSEKTQMVVGKLMFLLHPTDDCVFRHQLDDITNAHVARLIEAGPPDSTYDMPRYDDIRGGATPAPRADERPRQEREQEREPEPGRPAPGVGGGRS